MDRLNQPLGTDRTFRTPSKEGVSGLSGVHPDLGPDIAGQMSGLSGLSGEGDLARWNRNSSLVLGVDIGASGAIAVLTDSGQLIEISDMPVLADGPSGRRAVNAPLLAGIVAKTHATRAFVEYVGARPGEGAVGAFAFGRSRGVIEGVLGALSIPATLLAPASWKRAVGLPAGREGAKDAARSEAIRRWPDKAALFARVKDDGRAEAALIAVAGLKREARND